VRDLVAERTLATFAGLGGAVSELCFGAQDATLAVRSASGLGLFRVSDGESLARLVGETGLPLAFDAAAGRFVEAPGPAEPPEHLRAWDGATGEPEPATTPPTSFAAWVGPQERVLFSRVSPGGERLFLVTSQGSATRATLVDLLARQARDYPLAGEGAPADCAFSPQGERVAVIEPDGVLRLRDARSLALLATCRGYLNPEAVEWSADGDWLLTRRRNGTQARLWYATERPDVYTLRCGDSPLRRVEFSPDGEHALTTSERGEVILWRTPSQPFRGSDSGARLATLGDAREPLAGASFDPRGGHVLSWGGRGVELRTIEDGLSERTLEVLGGASQAQLAPDGESILIQTSSGPSLWSREALQLRSRAGAVLWEIEFVEDALLWARFSPDGQRLFCVHRSGSLVCRDAMRGAELWRVPARRSAAEIAQSEASPTIVDLAFSPEAAVVAVAREDRSVHFFSTREGGVVRDSLAIFPPQSIDWSADGRRLLVTGATGRGAVRVEDLEPSQPGFNVLRAEFFHADDLTGGSFSPDGRLVLTTSLDGTIMVRDVSGSLDPRSMTLVAHLRGGGSAVLHACFSPGRGPLRVLAGFADGTARVWPVDPLPAAKARQPRAELQDWEFAREKRFALPLEYP
jgi:WD40 repeat protein